MLSKAKKGSHIRTRDNKGFEMKRLRFKCPPKNWETRSWSGDGRRPSGALHATGLPLAAHSIELALDSIELCLELATSFLKPAPVRLSQEKS
ncbi:unnamed protein product [Microthlaspi erraticum]|uniref:Uncharacterized protein n=1 Tax=Microthlaspi erraticum TaxID=1685480 RepID=A0A6D2J915_9BRAS|nr:unnamed protein product [Microthlaspi erraticum]